MIRDIGAVIKADISSRVRLSIFRSLEIGDASRIISVKGKIMTGAEYMLLDNGNIKILDFYIDF